MLGGEIVFTSAAAAVVRTDCDSDSGRGPVAFL